MVKIRIDLAIFNNHLNLYYLFTLKPRLILKELQYIFFLVIQIL